MSWTFVACVGIAFAWLGLFYLWGKGFLTFIKAERDVASSICFGYLVLQFIYQIIYLPFYFSRGSYRATVYIWIGIVGCISVGILFFLRKHKKITITLKAIERVEICVASVLVLGLAFYISLHVPFYGQDTRVYISKMNECIYKDTLWITSGEIHFHNGMCSMFEFFTIPALLIGIKPYYIALFTVRIVGICLFSFAIYEMGKTIFNNSGQRISFSALCLSVLTPYLLMFWGSNYTAEFFYWRIYEAKGFCQFVLFPIGFSVFLGMFKKNADRKILWKEQLLVGLSAVSVSASSLTPYMFFLLMGIFAVLGYDKLKNGWKTIGSGMLCALPNIAYLIVYILNNQGIIVL